MLAFVITYHDGAVAGAGDRAVFVVVLKGIEIDRGELEITRRRLGELVQLAVLEKQPAAARTGRDRRFSGRLHFQHFTITRTVHGFLREIRILHPVSSADMCHV